MTALALKNLFAVLLVLDVLVRPWKPVRKQALGNVIYLALAYVPAALVPIMPRWALAAMVSLIGVGGCASWARVTGLHEHNRFHLTTLGLVALSAPAAVWGSPRLVASLPVFALLLVVGTRASGGRPEGFLQRLCLAWVGVIAFGWLWASSLLLLRANLGGFAEARLLLAAIACTKAADTIWAAWRRFSPGPRWMQPVLSPFGGLAAGLALGGTSQPVLLLLGVACGVGLGFGSRAHDLIHQDLTGEDVARPLKTTMIFGAAFSFGLAALVAGL